jgi:hypothetical protein
MKLPTPIRLHAATWLGLGVLFATPLIQVPRAQAQLQQPSNPIQDLQQGNSNDLSNVFNGNSGTGGATSIMNLMNRIQLMDGRSFDEVSADQMEGLNSSADALRKQQRQIYQTTTPGSVSPAAATPTQPVQRQ